MKTPESRKKVHRLESNLCALQQNPKMSVCPPPLRIPGYRGKLIQVSSQTPVAQTVARAAVTKDFHQPWGKMNFTRNPTNKNAQRETQPPQSTL
jgi:hypothetical protein